MLAKAAEQYYQGTRVGDFSGIAVEDRESPPVKLPDRTDHPISAYVSDNYFDVLPGEKAEVIVTTSASLAELQAQMKVISLTDAFAVSNQPATVTAAH